MNQIRQKDLDSMQQVHDFWFTDIHFGATTDNRSKLWFGGGTALDTAIKELFEPVIVTAIRGELDHWQQTSLGAISLITLLDQFPLNIFRKSARAFSGETKAIEVCKSGLEHELDLALSIPERVFFYLPLKHSENIGDQKRSVELYRNLHGMSPPEFHQLTEGSLEYAIKHQAIIQEFGRYPYRNEVLNRNSTTAELVWLDDNPQRFGQ